MKENIVIVLWNKFIYFAVICNENMKRPRLKIFMYCLVPAVLLSLTGETGCLAQKKERIRLDEWKAGIAEGTARDSGEVTGGEYLPYIIEGGDTVYVASLPAARVYQRLPRQKGREWRQYYRLVYNFSKVYPYALVARKLVHEADSTIAADNLRRGKKDKYINTVQKELFEVFEQPMRNLTVSQGALLMRLIDREAGKSSFNIIRDYKNRMAAGFWQGIAKMFGTDLKKPYDPEGEDKPTEELVQMWEAGQFEGLYYSLFWQYPPTIEIPSKYR